MSQLDDLVTVYGRIDDAVVENPDLLPKVAAMLPPYRQEGVAGWYRSLQDWQQETGVQLVEPQALERRSFAAAQTGLSAPLPGAGGGAGVNVNRSWATQHWLDGRRALADSTLARIEGQLGPSDAVDPTLLLSGIALNDLSAQRFHSDMRRTADFPDIDSWHTMIGQAAVRNQFHARYQDPTLAPRIVPNLLQPISSHPDSFRVVSSPTMGTSVAFRTHHHLTNLDLADAEKCLVPKDWAKYNPPWCEMRPLATAPGDPERYEEVISADCRDPGHGRLVTTLEFQKVGLPDGGQILGYRIPDGFVTGLVTIDEGSLEVRPARQPGGGIHFVTTKRIQFRPLRRMPTPAAAAIGFLVWVLGWDSLAERFIYFLSRNGTTASSPPVSVSFPEPTPGDGGVATLLDLSVSGLKNYVGECIGSVKCSMDRAAAGDYGLTDYLSDLTKLSQKVTGNAAALAAMAASMCETTSSSGSGSPPSGPTGDPPPKPPGSTSAGPVATTVATTTGNEPVAKKSSRGKGGKK